MNCARTVVFSVLSMRVRSATYACVLAIAFASCSSGPGARQLSGTYVHPETGGVIIFRPDGRFYYAFTAPMDGLPRNLGRYHFDNSTDTRPHLQVRSAHYGLFSIRVSNSDDRVFLTHPKIFSSEQVYERR